MKNEMLRKWSLGLGLDIIIYEDILIYYKLRRRTYRVLLWDFGNASMRNLDSVLCKMVKSWVMFYDN